MNRHDYVGKLMACVDLNGCSPGARCVLEPDADVEAFLAGIRADVKQAISKRCLDVEFVDEDVWPVQLAFEPKLIRDQATEDAEFNKVFLSGPSQTPEQWEAAKQGMQSRVAAMPLRELIDEHGDRIGGTTWDELVGEELDRRIAAAEKALQQPETAAKITPSV